MNIVLEARVEVLQQLYEEADVLFNSFASAYCNAIEENDYATCIGYAKTIIELDAIKSDLSIGIEHTANMSSGTLDYYFGLDFSDIDSNSSIIVDKNGDCKIASSKVEMTYRDYGRSFSDLDALKKCDAMLSEMAAYNRYFVSEEIIETKPAVEEKLSSGAIFSIAFGIMAIVGIGFAIVNKIRKALNGEEDSTYTDEVDSENEEDATKVIVEKLQYMLNHTLQDNTMRKEVTRLIYVINDGCDVENFKYSHKFRLLLNELYGIINKYDNTVDNLSELQRSRYKDRRDKIIKSINEICVIAEKEVRDFIYKDTMDIDVVGTLISNEAKAGENQLEAK